MRTDKMMKLIKIALPALLALCLTISLHSFVPSALAQSEGDRQVGFYSDVTLEYSDNIFRLTDSQQTSLKAGAPEDAENGRFRDMESVSDYLLSPTIGVAYDTRGLWDKDLSLSARVKYNHYMENREKRHPEARIRLRNDIGEKGVLCLEGNFLFDFFKKNYLAGYNDENNNGNIARDERIYSQAVYNEFEGLLSYKHELFKDNESLLSQADVRPFLGYSTRSYNAPFYNRDRHVLFGGLETTLEFLSRLDLELVYRYENLHASGDDELVFLDETILANDMNGDNEIKANAALITEIDRSARRHTLEINPSLKLSKNALLFLGYEKRVSDYTSENPLDLDHYKNTSYRQRIRAGIRYNLSKSWSTEVEYRQTEDEDDEDGDYSENRFAFSIRYDFF